ncbi:HAMP domain-containing histidine kinase [bacterium]|nr:HAMP domain-containing histidine kinase [bacterium]
MNLTGRILSAVVPIPILFAVVNYFWLMDFQGQRLRQQEQQRAMVMAACLANNCSFALESLDRPLMQTSLNAIFLQGNVRWVQVVDERGLWLAHDDPSLVGRPAVPLSRPLADELVARAPLRLDGSPRGEVRLGLGLDHLQAAQRLSGRRFLWMSLLSLMATTTLVGWLAYRLTQPLARLARLAGDIARGVVPIEAVHQRMAEEGSHARRSSDGMLELRLLSRAFLAMSQRMKLGLESERQHLTDLQTQVSSLLHYQEAIAGGDPAAQVFGLTDGELVSLAQGLHEMALSLHRNAGSEADYRRQLEELNRALQETRGLLEQTDRYKNEFLGVVSHELRTPLTAVRAYAEILIDYPPQDPAERREFVSIIYRESDRLTNIINHLLDISRIESGRMRWRFRLVNLVHLLEEKLSAVDSSRVVVDLQIAFQPGGYQLWLDPDKVGEALEALLANAVEHSPPGAKVSVTLKADLEHDGIVISVEDQGPGVPREQHELIFSKFQQVRLGDAPQRSTGLSLALARAVVQAHQGRLSVESDGHRGSKFLLWLPRSTTQEPA